jgi:hypothetical protein
MEKGSSGIPKYSWYIAESKPCPGWCPAALTPGVCALKTAISLHRSIHKVPDWTFHHLIDGGRTRQTEAVLKAFESALKKSAK